MSFATSTRALALGLAAFGCIAVSPTLARTPAHPAAHAAAIPSGPGSLVGLWVNSDYKTSARFDFHQSIILDDAGKTPPLLPGPADLFQKRVRGSETGHPYATTKSQCLPGGVPQVMFGPGLPIEILETPRKITILFEEFYNFRQIYVGGRHAADPDPSYMGDSVAHWDHGDLVVDTIGLTDRTTLDTVGMPHSEAMRVTERLHRAAKDVLEVKVTIDDPKTYARPWTTTTHFKALPPDTRLEEDICENNRNQPNADGTMGIQLAPAAG
jgi:hypothetical protein